MYGTHDQLDTKGDGCTLIAIMLVRETMKRNHVFAVSLSLIIPMTTAFSEEVKPSAPVEKATTDEKPKKEEHSFADLSVADLKAELAKGAITVIDANGIEKFNAGHVPGAMHYADIQGKQFTDSLPKQKDALIVAYCASPT